MTENKTKPTRTSVTKFLAGIENEQQRKDAKTLDRLFRAISGEKPAMWGPSIVGYGSYHYRYDSGREGDSLRLGFSPRKQNLVLYIMPGNQDYSALLAKLGKHKTGKSCLYIKRLEDISMPVLEQLAKRAWQDMEKKYPSGAATKPAASASKSSVKATSATGVAEGVVHEVPDDLKKALLANADVLEKWNSLTPLARNEWICWTTIVKKAETRREHIERLCSQLLEGTRRPCCWPGCPHRRPSAAKWFK